MIGARFFLVAALVSALLVPTSAMAADPRPYRAASVERYQIRVFPFDGDVIAIPVPNVFGRLVYSFDGSHIYAEVHSLETFSTRPGLFKIEFNPLRTNPVPGSTVFSYISDFAVSQRQDRIVVSGRRSDRRCNGLYELSVPDGQARPILETSTCLDLRAEIEALTKGDIATAGINADTLTGHISLAPDGRRAVLGSMGRGLMLMDLATGTTTPLGTENLFSPKWSPDGKVDFGLQAISTGFEDCADRPE